VNVGSLVVPAPRANYVARSDQFHTSPSQDVNLSTEQSIDDQEATMMTVGLLCGGDIPVAGGQAPDSRLGFASGPLIVNRRQEIPNLRVGIDDADETCVHLGHLISRRPASRACFAKGLTSRASISA
jgi:hypothetical protein